MSATHSGNISTTYDNDGWGSYEDEYGNYEKSGETFYLFGLGDDVSGYGKWGWANEGRNGINGPGGEYKNRIASFVPGIQVGMHRIYTYSYTNSKGEETESSRDGYKYYDWQVFVQYFKI